MLFFLKAFLFKVLKRDRKQSNHFIYKISKNIKNPPENVTLKLKGAKRKLPFDKLRVLRKATLLFLLGDCFPGKLFSQTDFYSELVSCICFPINILVSVSYDLSKKHKINY